MSNSGDLRHASICFVLRLLSAALGMFDGVTWVGWRKYSVMSVMVYSLGLGNSMAVIHHQEIGR